MSGIKEQEFKIMSLSAEKLISRYEVRTDSNNNAYISYSFKKDDSFYINSTAKYSDNALFFQIRKVTNAPSDCGDEFLMDKIVYVNCGSLFSKYSDKGDFTKIYTTEELKPYSNKINLSYRLRKLFEQGIYIDFGDGNEVKFIPFDKSNSMARQNKISFIRADLRDELNQRLNLDVPFVKEMPLSKFYSYRGLYMSDSHRVAWTSEEVRDILNSETVIVIDDVSKTYKHKGNEKYKIVSATEDTSEDGKWDITSLSEVKFDIFDGEGIVSQEYAKLISQKLGIGNATSFQIRMPFTKGMLHEVDFHKLVPEIVAEVTGEKDVKSYIIKDFFGNPKDIMKAQIILPVSMFKCAKWLKAELNEEDPVAYYFDKFYMYDHALYVIKTDLNYGRGVGDISYTSLNYQFFNTLDFSEEDLQKLIDQYRSWIRDPLFYYKNIYSSSLFDSDEEYGDDDGMDDEEKEKYTTWQYALKYSDDFCRDDKIKGILESLSNKLKMDLLFGRIIVPGEVRFLSRDLLAFFVDTLKLNEKFASRDKNIDKFMSVHCLDVDRFFMPSNKIGLNNGFHYPIFRSPHLSRNEQCALKYYSASTSDDSILGKNGNYYRKYFSHLKGVLFVARSDLAPLILGGADFDGDTIKIISDESVRKAVLSGVYDNYKRKLDIITIPSGTSKPDFLRVDVDFNIIRNTFDNKIGQISNNSIRLGKYEYGKGDPTEHSCYECTIFTGLEIDAAKTGKHPTYSLNEFIKYVKGLEKNNDTVDYMKFMKSFTESSLYFKSQKMLSRYLGPKNIEIGDDKISYIVCDINGKKKRNVVVYKYDVDYRAIDKLPKFFMDSIKEDKVVLPKKDKDNKLFRFLDKTDKDNKVYAKAVKEILESNENKAIIDRINYIIEAYKYINKVISNIRSSEESAKATIDKMEAQINTILQMQYSQEDYDLYSEEIVPSLVSYLIENTNHASIQEMVDRFYARGWMYTLSDKRLSELHRILQWNDGIPFESREECEKILTNFNSQGYFLLFYVLKEVFMYFEEERSIPDKVTEGERKYIEEINNLCDEGKDYYNNLKRRYISDQKINYLGCRKDSMEVCLSDIRDELSRLQVSEEQNSIEPSNLVLPVLWNIHKKGEDKSGDFFWELVTLEDLEREFIPVSATPKKKKATKKIKENENVR